MIKIKIAPKTIVPDPPKNVDDIITSLKQSKDA